MGQHSGVTNLTLQGRSRDVIIDHRPIPIQLAIYYFLLVSHWRRTSIFNRFQMFASKYIWITTSTCQGHVTSSIT